MSGAEAVGELVTGALVAGAVEGRSGERSGPEHARELCLNCGTALLGDFCHRCGQPEHLHRSLGGLWHDIAHGVLHFEGKIWNTLPLLVWRPGELTRRFIHGERARFVSPMALFLFSVFLMFATFGALDAQLEIPDNKPPSVAVQTAAKAGLPKARARLEEARARAKAAEGTAAEDRLDRDADAVEKDFDKLERLASPSENKIMNFGTTGWKKLDEGIAKANKNPNLTIYKIQSSAYKFSWALIPLSVPFLWLLYAWHRRFHLYDHAVFVTYSLSFMSLLVIVLTVANSFGATEGVIVAAATLIPPVHMYRQMRGAYGTRRRWAVVRTFLLANFATITLTTFILLLLALGVLG